METAMLYVGYMQKAEISKYNLFYRYTYQYSYQYTVL